MKARSILFAALISMAVTAVGSAQEAAPSQPAAEKRFQLEGKVVSIRPVSHQAVVDHKSIPGFMAAMAMPYVVKDSVELSRLKAGDQIKADVVVSGGKTWLEKIVVVKDSAAAARPR
jgi:protein SCO1/2